MQTVKQALKAGRQEGLTLEHMLATFLLQYLTIHRMRQPDFLQVASDTMESRGSIVEQNTDRRDEQSNRTSADNESAHLNVEGHPPRRYPKRIRKCPDRLYASLPKEH